MVSSNWRELGVQKLYQEILAVFNSTLFHLGTIILSPEVDCLNDYEGFEDGELLEHWTAFRHEVLKELSEEATNTTTQSFVQTLLEKTDPASQHLNETIFQVLDGNQQVISKV